MNNSLTGFYGALAQATTETQLQSQLMDHAGELFGVQQWGICLFDAQNQLKNVAAHGVSDAFLCDYARYGQSVDPILDFVLKYHAPAHEALALPDGGWLDCELYRRCFERYGSTHVMVGPIIENGEMVGALNFARVGDGAGFNAVDLAKLAGICTHLSARLASLRSPDLSGSGAALQCLTARETQIAHLVATGKTNKQIAAELWITPNTVKQALKRIFRKLDISNRASLVAVILSTALKEV